MNKYNKHLYQYFIKNPTKDFQPQPKITQEKTIEPEPKKQIYRQLEPVCFDIMEMIGKEYTIIKQKQKTKQNMSHVLNEITKTDENGFKWNEWCMKNVLEGDLMGWSFQCNNILEHYEKYPNTYIKMEIDEWTGEEMPSFMIELSKAFWEKNMKMQEWECEQEMKSYIK